MSQALVEMRFVGNEVIISVTANGIISVFLQTYFIGIEEENGFVKSLYG